MTFDPEEKSDPEEDSANESDGNVQKSLWNKVKLSQLLDCTIESKRELSGAYHRIIRLMSHRSQRDLFRRKDEYDPSASEEE